MVPLTNQQVVTMRRELEAENLSSQSQVVESRVAIYHNTTKKDMTIRTFFICAHSLNKKKQIILFFDLINFTL